MKASAPREDFWSRVARGIWLIVTAFALYILAVRVHVILHRAQTLCATAAACNEGQVTREWARTLHRLGLPTNTLALYTAAWKTVFAASYIAVGGVLIWRRVSDRMAVFTAFTLLVFGTITVAANPQIPSEVPQPLQLIGNGLALLGIWAILVFIYLFPDGRIVFRWAVPVLAVWGVVQGIGALSPSWTNGVPGGPLSGLTWLAALGAIFYVQIYRYRRLSSPSEQQQTKWIIYGSAVGIAGFILTLVLLAIPGVQDNLLLVFCATTLLYAFLMLIPLAIGFAMLRYRLWDVDVLINRTLVYGLLSASLGGLYVGGVVLLQALFRTVTGQGSGLAVAVSTLIIAALFQPLRRGFQGFIDQRFYRRKYDAARTLARFSERVRDDVDLDQLATEMVQVVRETMQPSHVSLWLR
jgi:hypothetical protein